ncbi:MAG: lysophospholipid acyltransferase family protein [Candidatus Omnitrophica bacterium]|nr:lysophospholipid acyltransferase family protein [Candidatus Omnitrophota bacterium]
MYYIFLVVKVLALLLPRSIGYFIAKNLALLQYYLCKNDRENVLYNLEPIIEDKTKIKKVAKKVFINFAYYLVDFFRCSKFNSDFIKKYVKVSGLENVDQSLRSDDGVVLLTAHLGNYELAGTITSLLGYNFSAVALPHKDKRTNNLFNHQRQVAGIKVIPTGAGVKKCFSALKGNGVLGLLGDRDFSGKGLKTKMFSRYAYLPRGFAFFALKVGVNVVPCFMIRKRKYHYHFYFEKPIIAQRSGAMSQETIVEDYTKVLERYIQKYPDQWYLFIKYWIENDKS